MTQITEATFDGGVLHPSGKLSLKPHERVRLIVQSLGEVDVKAREAALDRLRAGIAQMGFRSPAGARPTPTRDELHERG
jgi:predicted DNA-binding antitoxin AbrB/MazE fold protein